LRSRMGYMGMKCFRTMGLRGHFDFLWNWPDGESQSGLESLIIA
jgi:hypothetical protein